MLSLLALVISIALQIVAASIALRFMKITKYRLSWILLSTAFTFMAARKIIQLTEITRGEPTEFMANVDEWMGALISVMIVAGVVLIREMFFSLKRAETERIRSERRVLHAIIKTEENERKRFAKDLHDGLGPLLSTVKMSMSALSERINEPVENDIINNTSHVVNEAISTIKDISNLLSPHVLDDFGLGSAIHSFISKINKTKTINISFNSNIGDERFNSDMEVVLYRTACELINNTIKHSGASNIDIELNKHGKFVTLQYDDNGRGFDKSIILNGNTKGMGLSNIETRVKSVSGLFLLESNPEKGTHALIKINITGQEQFESDYE